MDDWQAWIIPVITALLGGGLATILKIRPETGQIVVKSAEQVVIMQAGLLQDFEERLDKAESELESQREEFKEDLRNQKEEFLIKIATLQGQLSETKSQRDELAMENVKLKREVTTLKQRVKQLEDKNGKK